ncbi:BRO-N domain-containing protein [Azorhizophilus paspali]|uniref:Bro-N domain-containing protein n=1 Tax=Azorhizophilus paspali TaxID=69963 RepID=A0ABV6SNG2_AZOPA
MQAAQVIPFRFESREVRTLLIDGQPWFCAADVCAVLDYANSRQAIQKNCREKGVSIRDTPTKGGMQAMTFIDEGNLYRLIIKSRKDEAQRFESWVCDEVLPAIRKHGRYEDAGNRMGTLLGQTIGTDGFHMLGAVLDGKVRHLPAPARRRAKMHIWSQVHKAFSVVSAEDIPASSLDAARNFIGSYSLPLEGEWLSKTSTKAGTFADILGRPMTSTERWLVYADSNGNEHLKSVPDDACVLSHRDLIRGMLGCDIPVHPDEMFEFALAAIANIKIRYNNQYSRIRAARKAGLKV